MLVGRLYHYRSYGLPMGLPTVAYVLHVLSAAFWTGATLYVVYAVLPGGATGGSRPRPSLTASIGSC